MTTFTVKHYRVEVWSNRLYRWMPTAVEAPNLPELFEAVEEHISRDNGRNELAQPRNRRIVEIRETVIPWPDGATDAP